MLKPKFIPTRLIEPARFREFQVLGPVTHADLAAWSVHTGSTFKLRMPPGRHFSLNASRTLLLEALADDLSELAAC
ncbi:MAG TPA: hypothetical protein VNV86_17090 [Candidatus Acidoferrum sp.]|nr:hypothetical protein [Candidatus Acidoferrum sp.]